jgi:hypothetical protein
MIVEHVAAPAGGAGLVAGVMQRKLRLIVLAVGARTHILAEQGVAGDTCLGFV